MTAESRFGWTGFYMEFADRLLAYREDRTPLVEAVHGAFDRHGLPFPRTDQFSDGSTGPLRDICPFTTMGAFNRRVSDTNRSRVAAELGRSIGVTASPPDSFDSIPVLNNLRSWFFRYAGQRDDSDIDTLWQAFADAIRFADSDSRQSRQAFEHSYNQALRLPLVSSNLTMGLYWIRPHTFLPLDSKSRQYIVSSLGMPLPRQIPPSGREYLNIVEELGRSFDDAGFPVHSFQELSLAADEPTTDDSAPQAWLVRAGREGQLEDAALELGLAIVDWSVPDLTGATDRDAIRERVRLRWSDASNQRIGGITGQLALFLLEMSEGDLVVLPLKSRRDEVAIGRVAGPYAYQEVEGRLFHTRPVDWIRTDVPPLDFGEELQSSLSYRGTVLRIPDSEAVRRLAEAEPGYNPPEPSGREYALEDIIEDGCFLEELSLRMILDRLGARKNLILQGPPGTGKTWLAKRLAFALIGRTDEDRVRRLQFHPNMSYEDFIRGFRPDGEGNLTLADGPFLRLVEEAGDDPDNVYVMVIEEINRGNPAQILGEMLTLLEADKRRPEEALALAYPRSDAERVHVPPNVYVIGTMNVADRSIALVDLALRRRFAFVDLEPTFGAAWREWVNNRCGISDGFLATVEERMTALNQRIAGDRGLGPQFRVGHSYVTPDARIDDEVEWFTQVVETEIGPLLDEYWFDNAAEAEGAKSDLLAGL